MTRTHYNHTLHIHSLHVCKGLCSNTTRISTDQNLVPNPRPASMRNNHTFHSFQSRHLHIAKPLYTSTLNTQSLLEIRSFTTEAFPGYLRLQTLPNSYQVPANPVLRNILILYELTDFATLTDIRIHSILKAMGSIFSSLLDSLFGSKEQRILILGLDNAGKTTILCISFFIRFYY